MKQKGFTPVLVLLVIALLAVGVYVAIPKPGGIEYIKKQLTWPRPTPTPTPTADKTAYWNTHTNTKLGFSLKLPVDLGLLSETEDSVEYGSIEVPTDDAAVIVTKQITNLDSTRLCKTNETQAPCIRSDYFGDRSKKMKDNTQIGGVPAVEFEMWRTVGRSEAVIQTTHEPRIELRLVVRQKDGLDDIKQDILSTFKFTN